MKKTMLALALPFLLVGCGLGKGYAEATRFEEPDIKDDFCGVHINFQFCKCAFHGQFCDAIGMDKRAADAHVKKAYAAWRDERFRQFASACTEKGGFMDGEKCLTCKEGFTAYEDACVPAAEAEEKRRETASVIKGEPVLDGPLDERCEIEPDAFAADWKKYSDIDDRIPFEERSHPAKQALTAYDRMIGLMVEGFELERDRELETGMIAELASYKEALVKDLKTNLLKSFWRLSWVAYQTIKSGADLGGSYSTLLNEGASVETLGAGLKVIQGTVPSDSALAIDGSSLSGQAKSIGANAALEAVDSLGDPVKIATSVFQNAANATLPSADLTAEEIAVLKKQHLANGEIDRLLAERRAANDARTARLAEIETEIARLRLEVDGWEAEEKERVRVLLIEGCKASKK